MGFLEGVKVIDFTHAYAGPFCTMTLADFGAEVIKIEKINGGDQAREWGPFVNDYSGYYASFNRGKKSLTLDLRTEEGQNVIRDLVKDADIVCSNFKAGTMEKYNLGYDELKKIKPDIIFATISGFGTVGKLARDAAYDNVIQAMSGIMDVNGFPDGDATKIGPAIGDSYSGLLLLLGTMIAYYHKLMTGEGQKVDCTMLGALFGFLEYPVLEYANNNKIYSRNGNESMYTAPNDVYKANGGFVAVSVQNDEQWNVFAEKMNLATEGFETNAQRFEKRKDLKALIEQAFATMSPAEIETLFESTMVPVASVINIEESMSDPQLKARNMILDVVDPVIGAMKMQGDPIRLSENEHITNIPSPTLGQHTQEVLEEIGYSSEAIEELRNKGIV